METGVIGPSQSRTCYENGPQRQADALPNKRGEIGYVERDDERSRNPSPDVVLPPRHPADRDIEHGVDINQPTSNSQIFPSTTSEVASTLDSISASKHKGRQLLGLFKYKCTHKKPRKVAGIELPTLTKFIVQILALVSTIVAWVLVARFLTIKAGENGMATGGSSTTIFMHGIFGVTSLGQLLLLERRIFRMRAERYSYLHPDEVLPSFRNRNTAPDEIIALSPWNRPPLPTYAAALMQSGSMTGDVEDSAIAQQPPPVYGNTRGSTFLLSGFLNEDQRLQRPPSVHSVESMVGRPKSYASRDDEWEEIKNAERARRLEETLAKLERPTSRT